MERLDKKGFTLSETLISVMLLGAIFLAVGGGMVVLGGVNKEVSKKSAAQTMLTSAISEVSNDISNIKEYDKETNNFLSTVRGYSMHYENDDTLGIVVQPESEGYGLSRTPLLPSKESTCGLHTVITPLEVTFTKYEFDDIGALDSSDDSRLLVAQTNRFPITAVDTDGPSYYYSVNTVKCTISVCDENGSTINSQEIVATYNSAIRQSPAK